MRRNWLLAGLIVVILGILAYAWIDGGREPLHEIAVPVPLPESAA
jgi:hypothetical protein